MFPYCLVSVLGTLSHSATSIGNRNLPENAEIYSLENEPWHEISNNLVCVTSKGSDQPAHTRSLIRASTCRSNILRVLSY